MDAARRIKLAVAHDQLETYLLKAFKAMELHIPFDHWVDRIEFWTLVLRANGVEPFPAGGWR